jgi:multiple sugar transport system permease protein/sn-glycerol 3-phosphate transport system permease protein
VQVQAVDAERGGASQVLVVRPPAIRHARAARVRRALVGYAFLMPSLVGVIAFLLAPVVMVAVISLFRWNLLSPPHFVGLENYHRLVRDASVAHSLIVTVSYVLLTIPLKTLLALLCALGLNTGLPGTRLLRSLYVIPWMATPVVMGYVWQWIFDGRNGALNGLIQLVGGQPIDWLHNASMAMISVSIVGVWSGVGYTMLFFLAGLQGIPEELYEAARVDGADRLQQLFMITIPLLRPTLLFVLVTGVIGSFQVFDTIFAMTKGGPGTATSVLNYTIYSTAFREFDDGYASTIAMLLFGVLLVLTLAQVVYFRGRTNYEF